MDEDLVEIVGQVAEAWAGMEDEEAEDALQAIADSYLESQGYDSAEVEVVDLEEAGYAGANGYYDDGSETILIDDDQVNNLDFEDVLGTLIEEAEHAANYQDTGQGYPTDLPEDTAGVGAMVGDTLIIEAHDEDIPAGHELLDVFVQAVVAEIMNAVNGTSSAPAVSGTGGGSEPGGEVFQADPIDIDLSGP
jgi:hypothetical protein